MTPEEAQRALLEVILRMSMTQERFRGFTHLRYQSDDGWHLLEADDNGLYQELKVDLGSEAKQLAHHSYAPWTNLNAAMTRLTITFNPPKLSVDMFDNQNNPMLAEVIIDVGVEQRVHASLTTRRDDAG